MDWLFSKNLSAIKYQDILNFLDTKEPESTRLDYKREIDGSEGSKKELAKDVSALANTSGGHLFIGIDEKEQIPISPPYGTPKMIGRQIVKEWVAQIVASTITPNIHFDIEAIGISGQDDKCVIIIRIPQSNRAPHMVTAKGDNRYYRRIFTRNNFENQSAEEYQVREMYERSRRMTSYVDDYLKREGYDDTRFDSFGINQWTSQLGIEVYSGIEKPHMTPQPEKKWVSFVACPTFLDDFLDISSGEMDKWFKSIERIRYPLSETGPRAPKLIPTNREITFDGVVYVHFRYGSGYCKYYLRINRNGFIELATSKLCNDTVTPPHRSYFSWLGIVGTLWLFADFVYDFYSFVDLNVPFRFCLNLKNTEKSWLNGLAHDSGYEPRSDTDYISKYVCREKNISYGETLTIADLSMSESLQTIIKRYATRLGNAYGFETPLCYTKAGEFPLTYFLSYISEILPS